MQQTTDKHNTPKYAGRHTPQTYSCAQTTQHILGALKTDEQCRFLINSRPYTGVYAMGRLDRRIRRGYAACMKGFRERGSVVNNMLVCQSLQKERKQR